MTGDTGTRPVLSWLEGPGPRLCVLLARLPISLCCPSGSDLLRLEISLLFCTPFSVGWASDQAIRPFFSAFVFLQDSAKGEKAEEKLNNKKPKGCCPAYIRK